MLKKKSLILMLTQEIESYPAIIGAYSHNKDDMVHIGTEIYILLTMGAMALVKSNNVGHF